MTTIKNSMTEISPKELREVDGGWPIIVVGLIMLGIEIYEAGYDAHNNNCGCANNNNGGGGGN